MLVNTGEECSVRAAEAKWHTETLRISKGNICAEFSRWCEQCEREQISSYAEKCTLRMNLLRKTTIVVDTTVGVRILSQNTNKILSKLLYALAIVCKHICDFDLDAESLSARAKDLNSLGMAGGGNEECLIRALLARSGQRAQRHGHSFSGSCRLVKQRSIGDGQTSQVGDHGLEVQQRLQTTLADLRLVRSIASVPLRVLEHVALDNLRNLGVVVTLADQALSWPVLTHDPLCVLEENRLRNAIRLPIGAMAV